MAEISYRRHRFPPVIIQHAVCSPQVNLTMRGQRARAAASKLVPSVACGSRQSMHIAIFQAVYTIDPRYEPYQGQVMPKVSASQDAAPTAAASTS
jgi:hypothetical protein